jgi:hypothetical protein
MGCGRCWSAEDVATKLRIHRGPRLDQRGQLLSHEAVSIGPDLSEFEDLLARVVDVALGCLPVVRRLSAGNRTPGLTLAQHQVVGATRSATSPKDVAIVSFQKLRDSETGDSS